MSEDLTKKLPKTDSEKLSLILTIVQKLETRVDRLELRLDNLEQRLDALEKKVDGLEKRVDERLYDTRPIWQKLVDNIAQLQEGQSRLEGDVREIKISVRNMDRRMSVMNDTLTAIKADYKDIDERVHQLDLQHQKPTNSST